MYKMGAILTSFALLLVVGGCANTEPTDEVQTKSANVVIEKQTTETQNTTDKTAEIILTAKVAGDNTVAFEWKPSEDIAYRAEGWRIVYGEKENPIYPSTWWFERGKPHREKVWSGLPGGNAHFRVCSLIEKKCDVYSNDIEIDIPETTTLEEGDAN